MIATDFIQREKSRAFLLPTEQDFFDEKVRAFPEALGLSDSNRNKDSATQKNQSGDKR
jgi:hypothetical protein